MIASIHKGGVSALVLLVLLVFPLHYFQINEAFLTKHVTSLPFHILDISFSLPLWVHVPLLAVTIFIQGIWFDRLMNKQQFFENYTPWPMIAFFMIAVTAVSQLLNLNVILFNFVFLYMYDRLFGLSDDELADYQLYLDIGTVYALGLLFFPEGIFLLPLILLSVNQFAVFDLNRFLLFLLSICMILIPALIISYLYITHTFFGTYLQRSVTGGLSIEELLVPEVLYTYLSLFFSLILLIPTVIGRLSFMQNQNRKIINVMLIHLAVGLVAVSLIATSKVSALFILSIPVTFIFAFGTASMKQRWFVNIFLFILLFTLILIQWVYVYDGLEV